jgi:enolase
MTKILKIIEIKAREILDSKGRPTVGVELKTEDGVFFASVPSGTSKGKYEAAELRDEDGRGVLSAIENIEKIIAPALIKEDLTDQKRIDDILIRLDGTENKSRLGVNAILPVSMAACRAGAAVKKIPLYRYIGEISNFLPQSFAKKLPAPAFNILNGGLHTKSELDFQEFMVVPQENAFKENLRIGKEIYDKLINITKEKYGNFEIGAEGGVAPNLKNPKEALTLIMEAITLLGYEKKAAIFLDVAASSFYKKRVYKTNFGEFNNDELLEYYDELIKKYPIFSIEDPFAEDDWDGFQKITEKLGKSVIIVGDDLLVTNPKRIKEAQEKRACNALLLKLNQIGTVSEAMVAGALARAGGWKIMVSHRSGETEDDFIADFSVGIGAEFIKSGAPFPKERMAKYNRLVKIEEELGALG